MSEEQPPSRFTSQNKTTHERLSTNTIGLVALSDFRKRRAEILEQQEREVREAANSRSRLATPDRSQSATPKNASDGSETERQTKRKKTKALVSFAGDETGDDGEILGVGGPVEKRAEASEIKEQRDQTGHGTEKDKRAAGTFAANISVGVVPRAMTKAALRRETVEREALRKEFLALQAAVKATEIAIPFVFYDGTNLPGGIVRVKKGDYVWLFLDKSRKVGAELRVGEEKNARARREWARVAVDDLMMVRGSIIIPHVSHPTLLDFSG
jgi:protein FAM50